MRESEKAGSETEGLLSLRWDEGYKDFVLDFPSISINEESQKQGISDSMIRLGDDPDFAKQVFESASKIAVSEPDPIKAYKGIETLVKEMRGEK